MKKNIFAVCDLEVDYALNFMDYLNQKKNIPFEIQAFTTVESLIAYGKNIHIELLLISQKAMCRQVQELEIGKIVILSEGVHPPELDRYPSVYKYQASSDVVREVMACYGAEKAVTPVAFPVLKKTIPWRSLPAIYMPTSIFTTTISIFSKYVSPVRFRITGFYFINISWSIVCRSMAGRPIKSDFIPNLSLHLYWMGK